MSVVLMKCFDQFIVPHMMKGFRMALCLNFWWIADMEMPSTADKKVGKHCQTLTGKYLFLHLQQCMKVGSYLRNLPLWAAFLHHWAGWHAACLRAISQGKTNDGAWTTETDGHHIQESTDQLVKQEMWQLAGLGLFDGGLPAPSHLHWVNPISLLTSVTTWTSYTYI